jgi:hypothetical protein
MNAPGARGMAVPLCRKEFPLSLPAVAVKNLHPCPTGHHILVGVLSQHAARTHARAHAHTHTHTMQKDPTQPP